MIHVRNILAGKVLSRLEQAGYELSEFLHTNSCFDMIARKGNLTIAIKVLSNIDSLRHEQAEELKKLSKLFGINAIVVGEKSKAFKLKKGVVYERYGIPVLSLGSFEELLHNRIPFVKYFKGKNIVEIYSEKLKEKRMLKGLSLQDLANEVGLTKESLHRYEHSATTSLNSARKLEKFLNCNLIKGANLLERRIVKEFVEDEVHDELLGKVHDLGVRIATFNHAPFCAVGSVKEELLIETGRDKKELMRKVPELKKTHSAFDSTPVLFSKEEFKARRIDDVAVVSEEEIESMSKPKDLVKAIRERKHEKRR